MFEVTNEMAAPALGTFIVFLVVLLLIPGKRSDAPAAGKSSSDAKLPTPAQALELIRTRRSIFPKDYDAEAEPVPKEQLEMILEAANWAPTHGKTGACSAHYLCSALT